MHLHTRAPASRHIAPRFHAEGAEGAEIRGGAENRSPGCGARRAANLLSIHDIKVFDGPGKRSLRRAPRLRGPRREKPIPA